MGIKMALMCIHGGAECTGCMMCRQQQEEYCAWCGEEIEGERYSLPESDAVYCRRCILKITQV